MALADGPSAEDRQRSHGGLVRVDQRDADIAFDSHFKGKVVKGEQFRNPLGINFQAAGQHLFAGSVKQWEGKVGMYCAVGSDCHRLNGGPFAVRKFTDEGKISIQRLCQMKHQKLEKPFAGGLGDPLYQLAQAVFNQVQLGKVINRNQ